MIFRTSLIITSGTTFRVSYAITVLWLVYFCQLDLEMCENFTGQQTVNNQEIQYKISNRNPSTIRFLFSSQVAALVHW